MVWYGHLLIALHLCVHISRFVRSKCVIRLCLDLMWCMHTFLSTCKLTALSPYLATCLKRGAHLMAQVHFKSFDTGVPKRSVQSVFYRQLWR